MPFVDETAKTFEGNALLKAEALHSLATDKSWTLADDSGLEVDALNGAPRYLFRTLCRSRCKRWR